MPEPPERGRSETYALLVGVGVMFGCFAGLAFVPDALVLPLAVAAGLAVAPQFPTLLAHTGTRVGEALAGRVSGYQLIAANVARASASVRPVFSIMTATEWSVISVSR